MNNRKGFPSRSTDKRDQTHTDSAMTQALGENSTALTFWCLLTIIEVDIRLGRMIYQLKFALKWTIWLTPDVKIMDNEQFAVSGRQ